MRRKAACAGFSALVAACAFASPASATPPIWVSSYGSPIATADDTNTPEPFGTMSFPFMGHTYTGADNLFVNSNGYLGLNQGNNDSTPNSGELATFPAPQLAVFWTDLLPTNVPGPPPPPQGFIYYEPLDDNADGTVDRIVVTWTANDFGCLQAFPACGNVVQAQLRRDGSFVYGYDTVNEAVGSGNNGTLVGFAKGGKPPLAPGAPPPPCTDFSQRRFPSLVGDMTCDNAPSNPKREFDLKGRNLIFTPRGQTGFAIAETGTQLELKLKAPKQTGVGQVASSVAKVLNHGDVTASNVIFTVDVPAGAKARPSAGCKASARTISCGLGSIAASGHKSVIFKLVATRAGKLGVNGRIALAQEGDPVFDNQAAKRVKVRG